MTSCDASWKPIDPLDVNGDPPDLTGRCCDQLLVEGGWYGSVEESPAHIVHLRFGEDWHRLYFDMGMVFWRVEAAKPETAGLDDEGFGFRLTDLGAQLGVSGDPVAGHETLISKTETMVRLSFRSGLAVDFINDHASDRTRYIVRRPEEASGS